MNETPFATPVVGYLQDETDAIRSLLRSLALSEEARRKISERAVVLINMVRENTDSGIMQSFLSEYGLSTDEGVALMCLAEALLRVPDDQTIDELIQDKIVPHNWASHIGDSGSILVNASTWALMLTGKVLDDEHQGVVGTLQAMVRRLGEPVIRRAVEHVMREMGEQFVLGQDIEEATRNADQFVEKGYSYSYDMLGETARTLTDAGRYHQAYLGAIEAIGAQAHSDDLRQNPGISVKLSALHPRYETRQRKQMLPLMKQRLLTLAQAAKKARVGLNVDAEEANRLDLSLEVIESVVQDDSLIGWDGFGIVVQAYSQRAHNVIDKVFELACRYDQRLMVRLVKGAYWDTEIKRAQVEGLDGFPVFTRKVNTDLSYIVCAQKLLSMQGRIYPQFATHNAHTMASILHMAVDKEFEFQRLHGMGDELHDIVMTNHGTRCRIYAPVGTHEDLLAYLVRRLLENGANSSFVNQIVDQEIPAQEIAADPVAAVLTLLERDSVSNPSIRQPALLFGSERTNSTGIDIDHPTSLEAVEKNRDAVIDFSDQESGSNLTLVRNPASPDQVVGSYRESSAEQVAEAIDFTKRAFGNWRLMAVTDRTKILRLAADLYQQHSAVFYALLAREAGKTMDDAVAELREAIDFLRYYASMAEAAEWRRITVPRGVIGCISPWNFPLAIFTGQIAAALVTGNTVLAKPAEQTTLISQYAVGLLHTAGIPKGVLQLLAGAGETTGAAMVARPEIAGICFTGSTEVASLINQQLAETSTPDAMLIAETGGLNAMIVDSTALMEQAVVDIVDGAFRSAGQRCSALRIVYVQKEVRDKLLNMLFGAMDVLVVGDPLARDTDIGPIIDRAACQKIREYCDQCRQEGRLAYQVSAPDEGYFVGPTVITVDGIEDMQQEIFGPVLHVAGFDSGQIDNVPGAVNTRGYGLTFGLHTRIDRRVQQVIDSIQVGNLYVNRNQIGAVVGSQPFGGEGLSGTGPKAGGPHYLRRFRRSITKFPATVDVVASGPETITLDLLQKASLTLADVRPVNPEQCLITLGTLLRGRGRQALSRASSMDCGPVDLPGPTGESNQLTLHPAGLVICLSHEPENLLAMTILALRSGNRVISIGRGSRTLLKQLEKLDNLCVIEGHVSPDTVASVAPDVVAADHSLNLKQLRKALALQPGKIIRLVTEHNDPAAFCHERSICIDTTAAGGNAALLAGS